jgi:tetratricopeptide (TPR) repeat protein
MHSLSEALIERLKNRQAILVAGLGCSELAELPGWRAILLGLVEHVADEDDKAAFQGLVEAGQLSTALALLRVTLPEATLAETLQGLLPARAQAPEVIQAVADAPWRGIITTSLDTTWTAALGATPDLEGRMVFAANASSLESGRGRFLLQLFGRPDAPPSLCLAPMDVAPVVVATGAAKLVEGLHRKWSFVFAGFSPNDPDLALLAGRILGNSGSTLDHFFVAPDLTSVDVRRLRAEFGLTGVAIDGNLEDALEALARACQLASDKPTADDVEAWLERLTADRHDEEARRMLDQGLAKLRENEEWERLVAALVTRAEIETDAAAQAADLYQAATVLDKELAATDRGYPVVMMALHLTPHDASLLDDAKRMAEKIGQTKEYLEELRHIEKEAADSPDLRAMRLGVARMLAEDPSRQDEAIAAYQKMLDRDPADADALTSLEELLRKAERWDALSALYQKILERDPADMAIHGKLEDVCQRTQKTPQLIELLQARLAHNPDDAEAWQKLEALYEQNQRWQPLASMYERRLEKNPDDGAVRTKLEAIYDKTQQWQPLGALYARDLAQNPDSTEALTKVEALYRKSEQWRPLAELLERKAGMDPASARTLRLERAAIFVDKLKDFDAALAVARGFCPGDPAAADEIYSRCLARDPGNADALLALSDLARDKGDHLRAAKFILDAAERTQNPLELGRLFTEAGTIYLEQANDQAKAVELFERALSADPEQTTAAGRLLVVRERTENWAAAEPLLDLLVRKSMEASDDGSGGRADMFVRQAHHARKLGKVDKAITALEVASKLNRASAAIALQYGDLLFENQKWADARGEYQRARELFGDKLDDARKADLFGKLGTCAAETGDRDAAVGYLREALAADPNQRGTLEALLKLETEREAWKEVVDLERKLLALTTTDGEKARILDEIGDVLHEKQGDWLSAMDAYREALVLQPQRRTTLYKTLEYHTQEKEWSEAAMTLEALAGLETEPAARAKLYYAMAAIHRDEMKDAAKAIALFTKVLEDEPLYPKAFEAIEKLLGEDNASKELELAYRAQLNRLPESAPPEMKLRLWDALGDAATKSNDKVAAVQAFEMAVSLDGEDFARREKLANLYFAMGATGADKAIVQHQALVARKPDRVDSYKALAALFFHVGAQDKMWCVAGAMTCLAKADPRLRAIYENFRPTQVGNAPGRISEHLWPRIIHPDENTYLSALLALLSPALASATAQPHRAIGIDRQGRLDTSGNQWPHTGALRYAAFAVDAMLPDVFIKRDFAATSAAINLKEKSSVIPTLFVGAGFDQLVPPGQVVFDLAKRMVELRPEHFARIAAGTPAALEGVVRAGLQLGGMPIGGAGNRDEIDHMAKLLDGQLSTSARVELKLAAKRYVEACGDTLDIGKWIAASDLTASRAALAVCGDIAAAARALSLEPAGQTPLSIAERIYDLLRFFVSEDHFAVRAALGLQVVFPAPAAPQPTRRPSQA